MKLKIPCFSVALALIAVISTSASAQNHGQFHSNKYSGYEATVRLMGHFPKDAPLSDTPTDTHPSDSKPVIIPEGLAVGMLIHKVDPKYPGIAKAARISGIVTLKATISKTGEISNLHVECGPEILQEPSLKAVREWKYRPYLLRGKPVEVQTTIRVTFALGGKKKLPFSKDSCPDK